MRKLPKPKRRNPHAVALQSALFKKRVVPSRKKKQKRERDKLRRSLQEHTIAVPCKFSSMRLTCLNICKGSCDSYHMRA